MKGVAALDQLGAQGAYQMSFASPRQAERQQVVAPVHEPALDQRRELAAHLHRQEVLLQGSQSLPRRDVGGPEYPLQAFLAPLLQFDLHHMVQEPFEAPALLLGPGGGLPIDRGHPRQLQFPSPRLCLAHMNFGRGE
jgi:hypothetical protein